MRSENNAMNLKVTFHCSDCPTECKQSQLKCYEYVHIKRDMVRQFGGEAT